MVNGRVGQEHVVSYTPAEAVGPRSPVGWQCPEVAVEMAGPEPLAVEFLFYADCPSHDTALARLREALQLEAAPAALTVREVRTEEEAQEAHFPGSPTIRINGKDLQPRGAVGPYSLTCRMYFHAGGRITPLPTLDQIRAAIQRHTTTQARPAAVG